MKKHFNESIKRKSNTNKNNTGKKSFEDLIPWKTEVVDNMIAWMKNYNDNPKNIDKIRFYGFDM